MFHKPKTTIFTGMSRAQLQAQLLLLQQAYLDLVSGNKGENYSYTQGDGAKSVTYTRANLGALTQVISEIQQMLGLPGTRRRPLKFWYR